MNQVLLITFLIGLVVIVDCQLSGSSADSSSDEDSKTVIQQEGQKSDGKQAQQQESGEEGKKNRQTQIQEEGGQQNQQQISSDQLYMGIGDDRK